MTTPNAELAYRVLDHIDAHPESWDQANWFKKTECGTAGCFAGWALKLGGAELELDSCGIRTVRIDGREFETITSAACRVLDIDNPYVSDAQLCDCGCGMSFSQDLFAPDNTREDLGRLVAEIFGPRPERAS